MTERHPDRLPHGTGIAIAFTGSLVMWGAIIAGLHTAGLLDWVPGVWDTMKGTM